MISSMPSTTTYENGDDASLRLKAGSPRAESVVHDWHSDCLEVNPMQIEAIREVQSGVLNLESEAGIKLFKEKYMSCITTQPNGETLVHCILRESEPGIPSPMHQLLEVCLQLFPTILEDRNAFAETPLITSIDRCAGRYLKWLVSKTPGPAQAIACTGLNGGNCLHVAIQRRVSDILYLIEMCDTSSLIAVDDYNFTPLHYAVDARFCTTQQLQVVKALLIKCPGAAMAFTRAGHSVYKVSKLSWDKYNEYLKTPQAVREQYPFRLRQSKNRSFFSSSMKRRIRTGEGITKQLGQQIQQYLKEFIIREFDLKTCVKILYDEGKELDLVLNLTKLKGLSQKSFLTHLKNLRPFFHFDDVISHVTIPKLGREENGLRVGEHVSVSLSVRNPPINIAAGAVIVVFDMLRQCGVKKIVRLTVEDHGDPPYDNETIEAALSGFDIDDWDWRTPDVCVETIGLVAPNVKSLKLYTSGNNNVLRSWSASYGLIMLSQLREVTLVINKVTLQSRERILLNIARFRARLDKQSQGKIRVIVEDALGNPLPTNLDEKRRRQFLKRLFHITTKLKRISSLKCSKIALIEDSIGLTEEIRVNVSRGCAFVQSTGDRIAPWWSPISGRGNTTAEVLSKFTSSIELYVARVVINPDDPDTFVPCIAKAIRWAVSQDVDVICLGRFAGMLWQANIESFGTLEAALNSLIEKDIIFMTISRPLTSEANSETSKLTADVAYMLKKAGALCIATTNSKGREADFLFPGQYITPAVPTTMCSETSPNADSVSLALATSLAAQILSFTRGMPYGRKNEAISGITRAQGRVELVKEAFKRFSDNAGNVWLDRKADWLYSMVGAVAAAADAEEAEVIDYGTLSC